MNDRKERAEGEERARYLTAGGKGSEPAFTLSAGELANVVEGAVKRALGVRAALVDKATLCAQLCCSAAHVDNLRKVGLPVVKVGEAVRFDTDEVMAWLRSRTSPENDR